MRRTTFTARPFAGFAIDSAAEGESVRVQAAYAGTSDSPLFHLYANQLEEVFLSPAGIRGDSITKFFAVQHIDGSVDLFTDYTATVMARVNRDVAKGDEIFVHDIGDISEYRIRDVEIQSDDVVACIIKAGWRYALYFDASRKIEADHVWQYLGMLMRELHIGRITSNIQQRLLESRRPHVITEGKTDWRHIEAARQALRIEQPLGYATTDESLGDAALLQVCERLAEFGPSNPNKVIAIFDRDNPQILRKLQDKGALDGFQRWGNNVYSLAIPKPAYRASYNNVSIELLYADEDLRTRDSNGKRLYFDHELKVEKIPGSPPRHVPISPVQSREFDKKPFDGKAELVVDENGQQIGLSKARFAELVFGKVEPFDRLNMEGFAPIFRIIESIMQDSA